MVPVIQVHQKKVRDNRTLHGNHELEKQYLEPLPRIRYNWPHGCSNSSTDRKEVNDNRTLTNNHQLERATIRDKKSRRGETQKAEEPDRANWWCKYATKYLGFYITVYHEWGSWHRSVDLPNHKAPMFLGGRSGQLEIELGTCGTHEAWLLKS